VIAALLPAAACAVALVLAVRARRRRRRVREEAERREARARVARLLVRIETVRAAADRTGHRELARQLRRVGEQARRFEREVA
jgi:hypothetical protein